MLISLRNRMVLIRFLYISWGSIKLNKLSHIYQANHWSDLKIFFVYNIQSSQSLNLNEIWNNKLFSHRNKIKEFLIISYSYCPREFICSTLCLEIQQGNVNSLQNHRASNTYVSTVKFIDVENIICKIGLHYVEDNWSFES